MALLVHPGYMGYANVGGVSQIRFTDANITVKQDVNIPDLIMGHWDHLAYNYNKIDVSGSMSGPITDDFATGAASIWTWATDRTSLECGELAAQDVTLYYYCGTGIGGNASRAFTGMRVNSITFSCAAGDIAQFSMDLIGKSAAEFGGSGTEVTREDKLVTWDQTSIVVTPGESGTDLDSSYFSNFEFTVANNIEAVYAIGQANLFPFEVVPGLRTITGSLSAYDIPGADGFDTWAAYNKGGQGTIAFNIGGTPFSMSVWFHRVEPTSSVGPIISTIAFTAAGIVQFP